MADLNVRRVQFLHYYVNHSEVRASSPRVNLAEGVWLARHFCHIY